MKVREHRLLEPMYHGTVKNLAGKVCDYIEKADLLRPGHRVGLAVSGGADSVALLRLMLDLRNDLGIVLVVVHFDHKLRGADSDADEAFVRELSRQRGLEFFCASGDVALYAGQNHLSIETAARSLRYGFFSTVLTQGRLNRIATAHTLDDQAETVLLKLTRGAGTRGLAGIYPKLEAGHSSPGGSPGSEKFIVRPLLEVRRQDIEKYLLGLRQQWREDTSNRDLRHSRNLIRHGILPRLERNLNPNVRETLAEAAEIARAEEEYWEAKVAELLPKSSRPSDIPAASQTIDVRLLLAQPKALQRRLVRAVAESLSFKLDFQHVEQIIKLASSCAHPATLILPGGWKASRQVEGIRFCRASVALTPDYEYKLPVPGRIAVREAGRWIEAALVQADSDSAHNLDDAIDPALLSEELSVRNWRPGDRFWPAHSKSPKKIKKLLQQGHITGPERKGLPVVVSGANIVWMAGFATPLAFQPCDSKREAVVIQERELSEMADCGLL